jgi:pimeloyl-ACP methyl ester carboxylesterase
MQTEHISLDAWISKAEFMNFDGHRIAFWSEGVGPPLLLVHGYPTAAWDWSRIWNELCNTRRVIACDMLGFGLSDKPAAGYSIHRQADLQEHLLRVLGIDGYDLLAHDYGDSVGQELLARAIDGSGAGKLGRIAFLNGGLFPEQHRPEPVQRLGVFSRIFGVDTKPTETELDAYWRLITANSGHRISHKLLHYLADRRRHRTRWVSALQQSTVPLKLIDGGADGAAQADRRRCRSGVRQAHVRLFQSHGTAGRSRVFPRDRPLPPD